MTRSDVALVALLLVGVAEAGALALRSRATPTVVVPLLLPGEAPEAIFSSGGAEARLRARGVAIGDYVTIEDLARGALALSTDGLPGAAPLSSAERSALTPLVAAADQHRNELLQNERDARDAEAALDAAALRIVTALTPEQRAWVLAHRDEVSVGGVEAAYWKELQDALATAAP